LIGPDAKDAVPSLKSALEDPDAWMRLTAAVALTRIESKDESNLLPLIQFLKEPDSSIRATAARSLGEMGGSARSAIPGLRELARDDDDESVLREVVPALEAIEADLPKPARE
jgi:HEAT repeat protein